MNATIPSLLGSCPVEAQPIRTTSRASAQCGARWPPVHLPHRDAGRKVRELAKPFRCKAPQFERCSPGSRREVRTHPASKVHLAIGRSIARRPNHRSPCATKPLTSSVAVRLRNAEKHSSLNAPSANCPLPTSPRSDALRRESPRRASFDIQIERLWLAGVAAKCRSDRPHIAPARADIASLRLDDSPVHAVLDVRKPEGELRILHRDS